MSIAELGSIAPEESIQGPVVVKLNPLDRATFNCSQCGLCALKRNYVLPEGNLNAQVLIVGDAPGIEEDQSGHPFVGNHGTLLRQTLEQVGIPLNQIYVTHALFCRPPKNRPPMKIEMDTCRTHLNYLIEQLPNLKLVILMGNTALQTAVKLKQILNKRGTLIRKNGHAYLPVLSPAAIARNPNHKELFVKDFMFAKEFLSDTIKTGTYTCVDDLPAVKRALEYIQNHEYLALDIETTGLDFMRDTIIGISFTAEEYVGYYIPLFAGNEELWAPADREWIIAELKRVLLDPTKKLILQNGQFDCNFIRHDWDIDLTEPIYNADGSIQFRFYFDTKLAHHLIWQQPPHDLKFLARQFPDLSYYESELEQYKERTKLKDKSYGLIPKEVIYKYAAADADATYRLFRNFVQQLQDLNLWNLMFTLTMPLANVIARTEYNGVQIDQSRLEENRTKLQNEVLELEGAIYGYAGEKFNIKSKPQLKRILFEKLKLPMPSARTKETQDVALTKETLPTLNHPIALAIVEFNNRSKFLSTYVEGIREKLDSDGILHAHFNISGTETGRLSSSSPNLQNIPAHNDYRGMFIPRPGHAFICSDFSQIELRVLALFSNDRGLIDAFYSGRDIHTEVARKIFKLPLEAKVSKDQRRVAKSINFGIVYGIQAESLSNEIQTDVATAQRFINDYFAQFPGVYAFQEYVKSFVHKHKYVKNLFGRIHNIPDIDHPSEYIRGEAERTALNSPIQGSAAEITNLSAIQIFLKLREASLSARLALTIHDELVYETPIAEVRQTAKLIYNTMRETAEARIKVPALVDQVVYDRWIEPSILTQARFIKRRLGLPVRFLSDIVSDYTKAKEVAVSSGS